MQTKNGSINRKLCEEINIPTAIVIPHLELVNEKSDRIIGGSPSFTKVVDLAKRVAKSSASVFLFGESGTGKEVLARYIHNASPRRKGPFVAINCAAIPENLLESELFGHTRGAFTGAHDKKIGLFEEADGGTIFLDEIGDLSPGLQAKLLRVLQEKQIRRVGENIFRAFNARIISATHKNISLEINSGSFREDLFYRLSVVPIVLPPLRDRKEDILPLAQYFLTRFSVQNGVSPKTLAKDAVDYLLTSPWRGNVRELENAIERAVVLTVGSEIHLVDLVPTFTDEITCEDPGVPLLKPENSRNRFVHTFDGHLPSLNEMVEHYIEFAVNYNKGAKDRTAREIGVDRKTLYRKLRTRVNALNGTLSE